MARVNDLARTAVSVARGVSRDRVSVRIETVRAEHDRVVVAGIYTVYDGRVVEKGLFRIVTNRSMRTILLIELDQLSYSAYRP